MCEICSRFFTTRELRHYETWLHVSVTVMCGFAASRTAVIYTADNGSCCGLEVLEPTH